MKTTIHDNDNPMAHTKSRPKLVISRLCNLRVDYWNFMRGGWDPRANLLVSYLGHYVYHPLTNQFDPLPHSLPYHVPYGISQELRNRILQSTMSLLRDAPQKQVFLFKLYRAQARSRKTSRALASVHRPMSFFSLFCDTKVAFNPIEMHPLIRVCRPDEDSRPVPVASDAIGCQKWCYDVGYLWFACRDRSSSRAMLTRLKVRNSALFLFNQREYGTYSQDPAI